jgi:hypothetical protein
MFGDAASPRLDFRRIGETRIRNAQAARRERHVAVVGLALNGTSAL